MSYELKTNDVEKFYKKITKHLRLSGFGKNLKKLE